MYLWIMSQGRWEKVVLDMVLRLMLGIAEVLVAVDMLGGHVTESNPNSMYRVA